MPMPSRVAGVAVWRGKFGIPEAERLKREQGCAFSSMVQGDEVFEVSSIGARQPRTLYVGLAQAAQGSSRSPQRKSR